MHIRLYLKNGTTTLTQYPSLEAFDSDRAHHEKIGVVYHQTMMSLSDKPINTWCNGEWVDASKSWEKFKEGR